MQSRHNRRLEFTPSPTKCARPDAAHGPPGVCSGRERARLRSRCEEPAPVRRVVDGCSRAAEPRRQPCGRPSWKLLRWQHASARERDTAMEDAPWRRTATRSRSGAANGDLRARLRPRSSGRNGRSEDFVVPHAVGVDRGANVETPASPVVAESSAGFLDENRGRGVIPMSPQNETQTSAWPSAIRLAWLHGRCAGGPPANSSTIC